MTFLKSLIVFISINFFVFDFLADRMQCPIPPPPESAILIVYQRRVRDHQHLDPAKASPPNSTTSFQTRAVRSVYFAVVPELRSNLAGYETGYDALV